MKLPVQVIEPIITESIIVMSVVISLFAAFPLIILKNSAEATKAEALPPNPLKIATISGIAVIATFVAENVTGAETGFTKVVSTVAPGDTDITSRYELDNGQRDNFYEKKLLTLILIIFFFSCDSVT